MEMVGAQGGLVAGSPVGATSSHRVADADDPPRELSGLAWGVYVSLGLLVALGLVRILMGLKLRSATGNLGDIVPAYDDYTSWVGLYGLAFIVAAGVFIAWFFRAYRNLGRLGVENRRYGNGWAIGAWFVPILGLVRPKQIANDLWRGSEKGADAAAGWHEVEVPTLLHWWWGLFLLQGVLLEVGQRLVNGGYGDLDSLGSIDSGLSQIKTGTVVDVLGGIVAILGAVLAIKVVARISERLDAIRGEALAIPVDPAP